MNPQSIRLLLYLQNHLYITALEAMNDLGIFRLGARIWDLKQAGIQIQSDWMVVKNRFGEDCRIKKYWVTEGGRKSEG